MHMYARFWKRLLDFLLALTAVLVLSPLLLLLTLAGAVAMRGNPFFAQPRPGRGERIFRLIKFRTMSDRRVGGASPGRGATERIRQIPAENLP